MSIIFTKIEAAPIGENTYVIKDESTGKCAVIDPGCMTASINRFIYDGSGLEHTKGGMCILVDDKLFSGDTLFLRSVGRTDLYGGSWQDLKASIQDKLFKLDGSTKVYPGHGPSTTIELEMRENPFV